MVLLFNQLVSPAALSLCCFHLLGTIFEVSGLVTRVLHKGSQNQVGQPDLSSTQPPPAILSIACVCAFYSCNIIVITYC